MSRRLIVLVAMAVIAGGTVAMSILAEAPWLGIAGLALLGFGASAANVDLAGSHRRAWRGLTAAGWLGACIIPVSAMAPLGGNPEAPGYWYPYFALTGWVAAAAILPASLPEADTWRRLRWKAPALVTAAVASGFWLAALIRT